MSREIVFILEPDAGRVTVESSRVETDIAKEIERDLGQGTALNCARPVSAFEKSAAGESGKSEIVDSDNQHIHLFRLYHDSTVDGFGRRSVVQVAGCSIRCAGCYVPETHERASGRLVSIEEIITEINERRLLHDGVTVLGGEPFDQAASLQTLVKKLKAKNYHVCVYTGYTLESLQARGEESINRILEAVDLLVDGAFDSNLTKGAGEYRGSSNQRLILYPIQRIKMADEKLNLPTTDEEKRIQSETKFNEFMAECLSEGWSPTKCPHGCVVEPDGVCPHEFKSVALELGLI
jgi:anaerobic ribonucleoside-triphosphate reductase activating protein